MMEFWLLSEEFKVDLVNSNTCRAWILESIYEEGIDV